MFNLIATCDVDGGISKDGKIPWENNYSMKAKFNSLIKDNIAILSISSFNTISFDINYLPKITIVISPTSDFIRTDFKEFKFTESLHSIIFLDSLESAITFLNHKTVKNTIGKLNSNVIGWDLYPKLEELGTLGGIHLTIINKSYKCDKFMRKVYNKKLNLLDFIIRESVYLTAQSEDETIVSYGYYKYVNTPEQNFLSILKEARNGIRRGSRTVPTNSIFSRNIRFDLSEGFPLLTTRPLPLRLIFYELMWFIKGRTDNQWLQDKGVHIWDANSSKEFLELNNLPYEEGDIGPSYGFQFRYTGAKYIDSKTDYKGQGFDQLANAINLIKNNPDSRRIVINLWNPSDIKNMALPPCAFCYQFYVADGKLSCILMQRSSDIALAGGWNIATVSLLTTMIAKVCDLIPGTIVWAPNDIHVYINQLEAVDQQLLRNPRRFPRLSLEMPKNKDITEFKYNNLKLTGYIPHPSIKITMNG